MGKGAEHYLRAEQLAETEYGIGPALVHAVLALADNVLMLLRSLAAIQEAISPIEDRDDAAH